MSLSNKAFRNLTRACQKIIAEDEAMARDAAADQVLQRLIDLESQKVLSQVMAVLNTGDDAASKLRQLCDILLVYSSDDEEDEDNEDEGRHQVKLGRASGVTTSPRTQESLMQRRAWRLII